MDDGGTGMMKGVYWALVVVQRLEQLGGMKGVYWVLVRLQSKGRPLVRPWRGATTAGGVLKEGLPLLLLQGVQGLGLWLRAGLHLGLLSPIGRSVSHLSILVILSDETTSHFALPHAYFQCCMCKSNNLSYASCPLDAYSYLWLNEDFPVNPLL